MAENWGGKIVDLFNSALERNPCERRDFLRVACGEDDALRAEIESLLSSYDDTFLKDSPARNALSFASDAMVGKQIGAYRIVGKIGEGGMAVVYLAERVDQQFRKHVAIKMVRPGASSSEILRRFRNERQTLAALDHPNIVKLLDGGSTEQELPYLVMDYVQGVPIDQYCDNHRLSITERLQLFRTVCSVVQYAHQNLVIHRDLKPSNILITKDGTPRLLDFGIAKLLNPECIELPLITLGDSRLMTPEYASPEQVRGESVTNATDIYSLGVLLYELLSGHKPYRTKHHTVSEIERLVCEQDPEKPSRAIGTVEEAISADGYTKTTTPDMVGRARNARPEELRRSLQGDLDTIVMMSLRKEPQRRYSSVEEFSKDIERYHSGMPVTARKPTVFYRGGKFLRRHAESAAAAVIVLGLMAGLSTWEVHRIQRQDIGEQRTNNIHFKVRPSVAILGFRNLASRPEAAWLSTALSEMLTTELAAGEKLRTVPGETVSRTKSDLGLPDAESLAPDSLKRVRKNLGSEFVVLGSYLALGKDAGGQIRLDLRLQDTARGETIAAVSETGTENQLLDLVSRTGARLREELGVGEVSPVDVAAIRASAASNPEAVRLYSQGLAKLRGFDALAARDLLRRAVAADPSYPLAHSALAEAWLALGYESNAEQEAKKALDNADELSREDHLLVQGRYYQASKQWGKAIETYRTLFSFFPDNLEYGLYLANTQISGQRGRDALTTVEKLRNLPEEAKNDPRIGLVELLAAASLSDNKRVVDVAERVCRKAAASEARLLIARARSHQCRAYANLGQPKESRAACEEAQRIYREAGDLAGVAQTLHAMGEVPLDQGDLEQAKRLYEQALAITRKIGDERGMSRELGNIGLIFEQQGDFATAEKMYHEDLAIARETGDKHGMAVTMGNMGDLRYSQGRLADALAEYRAALTLARETGHKSSQAIDIKDIGDVLANQGDLQGAMQMYQQALPIQREIGERSYYASTLVSVGRVLRQKGDADGAKKTYEEAMSIQQQLGQKGDIADTQVALGELACDSGHPAEAENLSRTAIQEFREEKEADHEILAEALLSRSLLQQGRIEDALKAVTEALRLSEKSRDVTVRMPLEISGASVRAATKDFAGAEQAARNVLAEATKLGFVELQFEAALALGEIQLKGPNSRAGRARLERLGKSAGAKGFELMARKAAAASS